MNDRRYARRGTACLLARDLVGQMPARPARLAKWLGLTPERLEACVRLEQEMPRQAQWRLAVLVMKMGEADTKLARRGRRLKAQLEARAEFERHVTVVHAHTPVVTPRWSWRRPSRLDP